MIFQQILGVDVGAQKRYFEMLLAFVILLEESECLVRISDLGVELFVAAFEQTPLEIKNVFHCYLLIYPIKKAI